MLRGKQQSKPMLEFHIREFPFAPIQTLSTKNVTLFGTANRTLHIIYSYIWLKITRKLIQILGLPLITIDELMLRALHTAFFW